MGGEIRLAGEDDAEAVQGIYAPIVRDTAISLELEPPSVAEMARRVRETLARWPWLVCARDGEILGYAYTSKHRERAAYQWSVVLRPRPAAPEPPVDLPSVRGSAGFTEALAAGRPEPRIA